MIIRTVMRPGDKRRPYQPGALVFAIVPAGLGFFPLVAALTGATPSSSGAD